MQVILFFFKLRKPCLTGKEVQKPFFHIGNGEIGENVFSLGFFKAFQKFLEKWKKIIKITDIKVKESFYIAIFVVSGSISLEKLFVNERPNSRRWIWWKKELINPSVKTNSHKTFLKIFFNKLQYLASLLTFQ